MARTLAGGRRDAKLGITPSGKSIWLEKHPSEYKGWSASDHLYAAIIHGANRTRGGEIADAHRALAGKSRAISPADVAEARRTGALASRRSHSAKKATAPGAHQKWNVYSGGKLIDAVFYVPSMEADDVRRGLINHDGYPSDISVRRAR